MAYNVTLQFGLMGFPAKLDTAIEKAPTMSNLCVGQPDHDAHEATPLTAPKQCVSCGDITDNSVLVKGIKQGSTFALITQSAVAEKKAEFTAEYKKLISLVPHPASDFLAATAPGSKVNYLTPADASGADHYQLLTKLIGAHPELVFASLYTPSSVTALWTVTVRNGVLVLEERTRSQSLKPAPSVGGTVNEALYGMLEGMLDSMVVPYDEATYEDKFATAMKDLAASAELVTPAGETAVSTGVVTADDLMDKLRALKAA